MHKIYFTAFSLKKGIASSIKMNEVNIDFTGNGGSGGNGNDTNPDNNNSNGNNAPDINGNEPDPDINNQNGNDPNNGVNPQNNSNNNSNDNNSSTGRLESGSTLQVGDDTYTVDDKGNVVDKDGNIFKESKDVDEWLKSFEIDNQDDNSTLSIDTIKAALDTEITDENGNPVEFENTPEGVKSYINNVIELKSNEIREATVNKLFNDNPIVKQFVDYLLVNNGDYRGFGQRADRSGIVVDEKNESQQEAIIKAAAAEFGNTTLNDTYIKYLKDNGALYDEAKAQLKNLQDADKYRIEQESAEAREIEAQQQAESQAYWTNVKKVIDGRNIGGYKLPDTFVRTVNGQKTTATPDDFFAYLYEPLVDEDGVSATAFEREESALSDEDYLNSQLLNAWLLFSHGTYKDLVDMAIREENVKTLKLKAKENNTRGTIKITKPSKKTTGIDNIVFD